MSLTSFLDSLFQTYTFPSSQPCYISTADEPQPLSALLYWFTRPLCISSIPRKTSFYHYSRFIYFLSASLHIHPFPSPPILTSSIFLTFPFLPSLFIPLSPSLLFPFPPFLFFLSLFLRPPPPPFSLYPLPFVPPFGLPSLPTSFPLLPTSLFPSLCPLFQFPPSFLIQFPPSLVIPSYSLPPYPLPPSLPFPFTSSLSPRPLPFFLYICKNRYSFDTAPRSPTKLCTSAAEAGWSVQSVSIFSRTWIFFWCAGSL